MKIEVIESLCPQNHACPAVMVCPVQAIHQIGYAAPEINQEKCIGCGDCSLTCPTKALKGTD